MSFSEWKERLDLSKNKRIKIHKPFFRAAMILIALWFFAAVLVDGVSVLTGSFYVECPKRSPGLCENPFYNEFAVGSTDELYSVKSLVPGQVLGDKPSVLSSYFGFGVLMLVFFATVANKVYFLNKQEDDF